jgi:hypothetical protein
MLYGDANDMAERVHNEFCLVMEQGNEQKRKKDTLDNRIPHSGDAVYEYVSEPE